MSTICKKEFEDTKGATRIRKLKNRQHNGQKPTEKTKYRATQIPLKTMGELRCSRRVRSSCFNSYTHHVTIVIKPVTSHE